MRRLNLIIALLAIWICPESVFAEDNSGAKSGTTRFYGSIAVTSFANLTGDIKAKILGDSIIFDYLKSAGFEVISRDSLRDVLRKHRIRTKYGINSSQVESLRYDLQVDYILLGSYDIFIDREIPEAGLSMRLIDADNSKILAAHSSAANGEDFSGIFGTGRIDSIEAIMKFIAKESIDNICRSIWGFEESGKKTSTGPKAAIVPFDNFSNDRNAGDIVTSILLSELIESGWDIIEPGNVSRIFRTNNRLPRGEIDFYLLTQLQEQMDVDCVITGSVIDFLPGMAENEESTPEIEINCRIIDARTRQIISAANFRSRGSDSELIFLSGSCYSLGNLTKNIIRDFRKTLEKERNSRFVNFD